MTERIGIYRVERPIGRGGMGEVLLAWDDRLERRVAIKRIRPDAGLSFEQRERLRREARLAARLSHSAVVQVYDLVTDDAGDAIVMEYVEGQTLADRLPAGSLGIEEALCLAQEIAQGLAAAHEAGLIHRDLKAANIIVTRTGHAKILDFGLARPVDWRAGEERLTRQGFVIGTFHAMSPEQALGEDLDPRSDLFSFGILLYEMLTGRSPFHADTPAETLRRVVWEPAPDPRSLRPDLPAEAERLLHRLLAKKPQERPQSAAEVAAALERLRAGLRPGHLPSAGDADISELPTRQELVPLLPARPAAPAPSSSLAGLIGWSPRRLWTPAATVLLIAVLTMAVYLKLPSRRPPLRIAVAPIEVVPANDDQLALAGSGVLTAAISSLSAFEGLAPIDPRETSRGGNSPVRMARATAADEVLTSEIRRVGTIAQITLSRLQGTDARVLRTQVFRVSADAENLRSVAEAVASKIKNLYPGYHLGSDVPDLDVRDEDYAAFLEIKQRIDSGSAPLDPELRKLQGIVHSSPRFLEAYILAARLANHLFRTRGEVTDLGLASDLTTQAKKLAPQDPRPLQQELNNALAANHFDEAEKILAQLAELLAGDPELLVLRARLADRQGHVDQAVQLQAKAVEQIPSWQNLYWLADFEARRGDVSAARKHIQEILHQDPTNVTVKERLGEMELYYGDLAEAERIYQECLPAIPRRALNNLALAQFVSGKFKEAEIYYRDSLALEPDYVLTVVELASTEIELGRTRDAEAHYRRALALLEKNEKTVRLTPADALRKALCLVRLGRAREAVALAQAQSGRSPEDPNLLQQSALVYSIAGERALARHDALAALDKGLNPRWLTGSAFQPVRDEPEVRSQLAAHPHSS
jgi:serine/threonine-protein kinase